MRLPGHRPGGSASVAHAGLFDDEEARKAIVDLRNRIAAMDEQGKARAAESATLNAPAQRTARDTCGAACWI
jgi:hypothetical protein